MAVNYQKKIVTDGLVLCLDAGDVKSYPGSGTVWYDRSGNNRNGILTNGVEVNAKSLTFNGTNQYIEFGDVLDLGTNNLTICSWIKVNQVIAAGSPGTIYSKSLAGLQNYRYSFFIGGDNKLSFFFQGNGGSDITPIATTSLSANTWYYVAGVVNRSNNITLYINGVSQTVTGSSTISQWNNLDFQSNNPFRIGTYTASNNTSPVYLFPGEIGSTQMYHRILSQQEILQNYNAQKGRFGL